ncbi:tyrosine-protein phosphatase [Phenylobacterium sp.]|jgi:protein-tyrosine phosphatase|uniref:tyrosine-protein phosphatase n=1 Tax=Phenylobacterium sp. TaxID=1871053 RepID=UPI002F4237D6
MRVPPVLTASATRISSTVMRLAWNARSRPTSIYISSDPDAPPAGRRQVEWAVRGGTAETSGEVVPRPYYLLATNDAQARVAERLLPLRGGRNFRDLGGYRAIDGRQVRWGRIYRSGLMTGLTDEDLDYLKALGVRVICDLRTPGERAAEPNPFIGRGGVEVLAGSYDIPGAFMRLAGLTTRSEAVTAFAATYVELLEALRPQLTEMLSRLAQEDVPLAINCLAGKDRTGVASALVLSLLGVPRATVISDYALTETFTPPAFYMGEMSSGVVSTPGASLLPATPLPVLRVILGADPAVIGRLLAYVDAEYGGPVQMAMTRLGLSEISLSRLRQSCLI